MLFLIKMLQSVAVIDLASNAEIQNVFLLNLNAQKLYHSF